MSDFERYKYVLAAKGLAGRKQYVVEGLAKDERWEKTLSGLDEQRIPTFEKENKDLLINKGIEFAYQDINLEGIENCPSEFKNTVLFPRGYQVGLRRIKVEGYNHYKKGLLLEESALKDHAFIEGYNSGLEKEKGHKHR